VGDGGASRGPYQIGMAYWTDGCQTAGVRWDYLSLVWSRPHCETVIKAYWRRYGAATDQQRARMHNGGPDGHLEAGTLEYWRKVSAALRAARDQGPGTRDQGV